MILEMTVLSHRADEISAAMKAVGVECELVDADEYTTVRVNVEENRDPTPLEAVQLAAAIIALAEAE